MRPSTFPFGVRAAQMMGATAMQPMLACFAAFSAYRSRRARTRGRRGGRGGIGFGRAGILSIAFANPGFALDCLYAVFKSDKRAVWGSASEIRTPRTVLRVRAVESASDKNRDRDDQSPRHTDLAVSGLKKPESWLNCADGRVMQALKKNRRHSGTLRSSRIKISATDVAESIWPSLWRGPAESVKSGEITE